jgi:N utilization substance protein B
MLNRRQLRIKVLQALYAWYQGESTDLVKGEKELLFSVNKIYDLYLYYLLIFEEVVHLSTLRIEERKNKKLPNPEDLDPNLKFIQNRVFEILRNNRNLKQEVANRKLSWLNETDLMKKIFNQIQNSEIFEAYMSTRTSVLSQDKEFVVKIFTDFIANNELVLYHFEETSIFWVDDIDMVCSSVIKTINSITDSTDEELILMPLYKDEKEDKQYIIDLFRHVIKNDAENEKLISSKADNWENERIATMDMVLMKMAISEVKAFPTIPVKVTLNEYIEISKFYSTPKSNGFINGVLDKAFSEMKQKGEYRKTGRGLLED